MTTTNTDHLSLSETLASEPANEPDASAAGCEQAQAATNVSELSTADVVSAESMTKTEVDDDDLEEGELKDDDDDSDDDEVDGLGTPMTLQQPARLLPISGAGGHYGVMQPEVGLATGQPPGPDGEQVAPKKKRKKRVVRKVKVMKKVIKKVPKKKADQQPQRQDQQPLLPQQSMLPQNQTSQQPQPFDLNLPSNQPRLLPHITASNNSNPSNNLNSNPSVTQVQPTTLLPSSGQQQTTSNNLDSLLEQQILMLQELQRQQQQQPAPQAPQQQQQQLFSQPSDQQHAEILRAAATDEDLRYLQQSYLFNTPTTMNLMQQQDQQPQQPIQPFISQSNPITLSQPMPFTTSMQNVGPLAPTSMLTTPNLTSTTLANNSMLGPNQASVILNPADGLTPMMQQQLHLISQQNQLLGPQQGAPLVPQSQTTQSVQYQNNSMPQPLSQLIPQQQQQQQPQPQPQQHCQQTDTTLSSPDDESGKSSYEAISKMLTLLRNSANLSESSEINEETQNNPPGDLNEANALKETQNKVEYSLIPVLVQGIDYTKYKLLSQYEPKIKNDPRLNQQA